MPPIRPLKIIQRNWKRGPNPTAGIDGIIQGLAALNVPVTVVLKPHLLRLPIQVRDRIYAELLGHTQLLVYDLPDLKLRESEMNLRVFRSDFVPDITFVCKQTLREVRKACSIEVIFAPNVPDNGWLEIIHDRIPRLWRKCVRKVTFLKFGLDSKVYRIFPNLRQLQLPPRYLIYDKPETRSIESMKLRTAMRLQTEITEWRNSPELEHRIYSLLSRGNQFHVTISGWYINKHGGNDTALEVVMDVESLVVLSAKVRKISEMEQIPENLLQLSHGRLTC